MLRICGWVSLRRVGLILVGMGAWPGCGHSISARAKTTPTRLATPVSVGRTLPAIGTPEAVAQLILAVHDEEEWTCGDDGVLTGAFVEHNVRERIAFVWCGEQHAEVYGQSCADADSGDEEAEPECTPQSVDASTRELYVALLDRPQTPFGKWLTGGSGMEWGSGWSAPEILPGAPGVTDAIYAEYRASSDAGSFTHMVGTKLGLTSEGQLRLDEAALREVEPELVKYNVADHAVIATVRIADDECEQYCESAQCRAGQATYHNEIHNDADTLSVRDEDVTCASVTSVPGSP